ncbi:MAG: hypothetical protein PHC85_00370 [Candidatus Pacebacteria bacterium]|nr:hypothetical protein [Candidatus Paceibacterota bacterium]
MPGYKDDIQKMVCRMKKRLQENRDIILNHSKEYREALGLSDENLNILWSGIRRCELSFRSREKDKHESEEESIELAAFLKIELGEKRETVLLSVQEIADIEENTITVGYCVTALSLAKSMFIQTRPMEYPLFFVEEDLHNEILQKLLFNRTEEGKDSKKIPGKVVSISSHSHA